jgi:hypothetical protein
MVVANLGIRRGSISMIPNRNLEHHSAENRVRRFYQYLRRANIVVLMFVPFLFGLLIMIFWGWIAPILFDSGVLETWGTWVYGFAGLVMGISPLLSIWRKETYGPGKSIHGWPAVVSGMIGLVFFWGIAVRLILLAIFGI